MKKQWLKTVVCAVLAALCLSTAATAVEPRLSGITNFYAGITISDYGIANCQVNSALDYPTYNATLTVSLQRSSDGSSWTTAKIWQDSGSVNVSVAERYYVVAGYYYRLYCTVNVYDADGNYIGYNAKISNTVYRG